MKGCISMSTCFTITATSTGCRAVNGRRDGDGSPAVNGRTDGDGSRVDWFLGSRLLTTGTLLRRCTHAAVERCGHCLRDGVIQLWLSHVLRYEMYETRLALGDNRRELVIKRQITVTTEQSLWFATILESLNSPLTTCCEVNSLGIII